MIFWRLAGGEEDELLALRVLLFDLVAIFIAAEEAKIIKVEDFVNGPRIQFGRKWTTMVDESTLNLTVILHGTTQTHCIVVPKATDNASQPSTMSLVVSSVPARLFGTKVARNPDSSSPTNQTLDQKYAGTQHHA